VRTLFVPVYRKILSRCRKFLRIYNLHINPLLEIIQSKKLRILCMILEIQKRDLQIKGL